MSDEIKWNGKTWNEMNLEERSAYMQESKRQKARQRRIAAGLDPDPPAEDPDEEEGEDGAEDESLQAMAAERRERLLQGIDPTVAALISDAELDEIEKEERALAEATRKDRALKDVRAQMRQRARVDNDLISADVLRTAAEKKRLAEMVTFRVNLPGGGAGHRGENGFRVDGVLYQQGFVYTRPRAVFESLLGMHYRVHFNEVRFSTLSQDKAGNSAIEVMKHRLPAFEVAHAA